MSTAIPDKTVVAFYNNRNRLRIDRELEFSPDLPDLPEWAEPEEIIDPERMDAYTELCRLAIATTTRVLFLPREKNFMRTLMTGVANLSYKPTGGHCVVEGPNFVADFAMGDVDSADHGLAFNGTNVPYLQLGHAASVRGHFRLRNGDDDSYGYHCLSIGQGVCLIDRGSEYPTRVAGPEVVSQWTEEVLVPIEDEIKACAYEWLGDDKTDPLNFTRLV